jgi:hypothetical protein
MKTKAKIGDVYGSYVIVARAKSSGRHTKWLCRCNCGIVREVFYANLAQGVQSCEQCKYIKRRTHGESGKTPEYRLWHGIKCRTGNRNNKDFIYYGGNGITMYPIWRNSYKEFLAYILKTIGRRPSAEYSLDRIDNNKGYVPGNIRWSTVEKQNRNKSDSWILKIGNQSKTVMEWSRKFGVNHSTIRSRLSKGIVPEKAVCVTAGGL